MEGEEQWDEEEEEEEKRVEQAAKEVIVTGPYYLLRCSPAIVYVTVACIIYIQYVGRRSDDCLLLLYLSVCLLKQMKDTK